MLVSLYGFLWEALPHISVIDSLVIGSPGMAIVENRAIVSAVNQKKKNPEVTHLALCTNDIKSTNKDT